MKSMGMSGLLLFLPFVFHWGQQNSDAGIIALKFQNLWTLKQALIASKLPIAQQFVLLPSLATIPTVRPTNATTTTTARPVVTNVTATTARPVVTVPVTTARPANATPPVTTTVRPNTVISIQQLFPGGQFGQYPPQTIYFPGGVSQGSGISFPAGFGQQGTIPGQQQFPFGTGQQGTIPGQQQFPTGTGQQGTIPGQQQFPFGTGQQGPIAGQQLGGGMSLGGAVTGGGGQVAFPPGASYPGIPNGQQYPLSQSPLASPPFSGQDYGLLQPNGAGGLPGQFFLPGGVFGRSG